MFIVADLVSLNFINFLILNENMLFQGTQKSHLTKMDILVPLSTFSSCKELS